MLQLTSMSLSLRHTINLISLKISKLLRLTKKENSTDTQRNNLN